MKQILSILALVAVITSPTLLAGGGENLVIIKDYQFVPQHITIAKGQTVTWENREKRQYHSVWFEALGEEEPEDYLFPEDTYKRTFSESGKFPYRCGPHPEMIGSVTVTE